MRRLFFYGILMDFEKAYDLVKKQLGNEKSGHSMTHIDAVIRNAKKILDSEKDINEDIVLLSCLLHDCDDYKIVGIEAAEKMIYMNGLNC
jgi:uncharacterized protein